MAEPIILFVYARLDHVRRTIDSLLNNSKVNEHDLIVYSDAAADADKVQAVKAVRDYVKTITGFRSVCINYRSENYGLAKSIIEGVTEVLSRYERVIVLEDDMVTSPYFLTYMRDALNRFANDERVISIHGYVYPVAQELPHAFFLKGADCWGWATWRRGWALFNPDGRALLDEMKKRNLINAFNFNGTYQYSEMLEQQIIGGNDSWAIRWYASAFLADKLTLYPGRSLVHNIGTDSSGVHCVTTSIYDVLLSDEAIKLEAIEIKPSEAGRLAFERFFKKSKATLILRLSVQLRKIFKNLLNYLS